MVTGEQGKVTAVSGIRYVISVQQAEPNVNRCGFVFKSHLGFYKNDLIEINSTLYFIYYTNNKLETLMYFYLHYLSNIITVSVRYRRSV